MIKLLKLLNRSNGIKLSNASKLKSKIKTIKSAFLAYEIQIPIRTELEYFEASIAYQGLLNKQAFETVFHQQWNQLSDLWSHLSYQEKNKLIQIELTEIKNHHPFFIVESGKVIWIPFFNELLNTLYHSDLAIFELEQYFKLFKKFSTTMESRSFYGFYPYTSRFIDVTPLDVIENTLYFYDQEFKSIFKLDQQNHLTRMPLNKDACSIHPLKKDLMELAKAFHTNDWMQVAKACLDSDLIDSKIKAKIVKRLKKYENL